MKTRSLQTNSREKTETPCIRASNTTVPQGPTYCADADTARIGCGNTGTLLRSRFPAKDRTKGKGALGEPLYLDVVAALKGSKFDAVPVYTGRYGLGSKDTTPAQIVAVYHNRQTILLYCCF